MSNLYTREQLNCLPHATAWPVSHWRLLLRFTLLALLFLVFEAAAASAQTADLGVTQTASAAVVAAGTGVVYTAIVTNSGPNASTNAVFYENIPANTVFRSIGTVPTGWTCTVPALNGTTPISCT
jgi:uncharacterized repeat protein (TIGR01451 family)